MTATLKPTETIGDDLPILAWQIKRIMKNCAYQEDTKNEYVQWATGDTNRTSLRSITQAQAKKIIRQQEGKEVEKENWAFFNYKNPKHKLLLSLMHQAGWTIELPNKQKVSDLERFSLWLQSSKAPVQKKLQDMNDLELEKTIKAMKGIINSIYK